jgi:ABC-type nitrate/sulfonate/bicarbonate transport system substrate-binding protein
MSHLRRVALLCVLLVASAVSATAATTLRISLPPVMEALPIAFAEAWGMFDDAGLSVDVVGITDNQERSTALVTGNLDAVMSDVTSAVLDYCTTRSVVVVAGAASTPQPGTFRLALLSHAGFGPADVDGLLASDQIVGVTYRTDDEYLLDQFFAAHGAPRAWMTRYTYFSDMLQLAVWFGAKTLPVAVLPEPYYSYIAALLPVSGVPMQLIVLSDFSEFDAPPRVILFRQDFVNRHRNDVETFLRVVDAAAERLNATPRDEIINVGLDVVLGLFFQGADRTLIQQQTLDAMSIPMFECPAPVSDEVFDAVTDWMAHKGYLNVDVTFQEFARFDLLP